MSDTQLTPHFSLRELTATSQPVSNEPPPDVIEHLRNLCALVLEPLRDRYGPLHINSGYRSREVNKRIGGASDSAHLYGCAADVRCVRAYTPGDMVTWLVTAGLPIDQAIDELSASGAAWLHVGMARPGRGVARGQYLRMRESNGRKTHSRVP
jgi:zinc D-Ala-D-Ala carboxypeptidase